MTMLRRYQRSCPPGVTIETHLAYWPPKYTVAVVFVICLASGKQIFPFLHFLSDVSNFITEWLSPFTFWKTLLKIIFTEFHQNLLYLLFPFFFLLFFSKCQSPRLFCVIKYCNLLIILSRFLHQKMGWA